MTSKVTDFLRAGGAFLLVDRRFLAGDFLTGWSSGVVVVVVVLAAVIAAFFFRSGFFRGFDAVCFFFFVVAICVI